MLFVEWTINLLTRNNSFQKNLYVLFPYFYATSGLALASPKPNVKPVVTDVCK